MATTPKLIRQSWTIWFNGLSLLAVLLEVGTQQDLLPAQYQELALAVLTVVNIALRFRTKQPVKSPSLSRKK